MEVTISLSLHCLLDFKTEAEPGFMSGSVRTEFLPESLIACSEVVPSNAIEGTVSKLCAVLSQKFFLSLFY